MYISKIHMLSKNVQKLEGKIYHKIVLDIGMEMVQKQGATNKSSVYTTLSSIQSL